MANFYDSMFSVGIKDKYYFKYIFTVLCTLHISCCFPSKRLFEAHNKLYCLQTSQVCFTASQDVFTMALLQFQHLINKGTTIFLQLVPVFSMSVETQAHGYQQVCGKQWENDHFWSSVSYMTSEKPYSSHSSQGCGKE